MSLKGFQGNVQKSAGVFSNDPMNPRTTLVMKGKIRTLIETRPGSTIFFQGQAEQLEVKTIDLTTVSKPFEITGVESSLEDQIAYEIKTIEAGKHYRLEVKNRAKEGTYRGVIRISTDMARKPEILIRVAGNIEGVISIRPQSLAVGRLGANQPLRSGKVLVINNLNRPFKITRMTYDASLLEVVPKPLPNGRVGYSLEVIPKPENLPNLPPGDQRREVKLVIETSAEAQKQHEVKVYLIKR